MSIFLKKQQYLYWIPNLHYYFNLKKSKYVKSLMYSIVWSSSLSKYSYKLRMYSIMNLFLFELKKKRAFLFLKNLSCYKLRILNFFQYNYFFRFRSYFKSSFLFYKYWISYFFDEFMSYAPLHSMVKIMPKIYWFLKKSTYFLKLRAKKKKIKKINKFVKKFPKFIFLGFKPRSLISKTVKKFRIRTYLKKTAQINRFSDYSRYKLSLFFLCSYNLPINAVTKLYTRYYFTENLVTFRDFFLFLDRKINYFLKNIYSFSNIEIDYLIYSKKILLNGSFLKNIDIFLHVGDFLSLTESSSTIYNRLYRNSINLFSYKNWYYFFFFFNRVQSFNSLNLMNLVYIKKIKFIYFSTFFKYLKYSISFKYIKSVYISEINNINFNYLELVKAFTSFLLIQQKKSSLYKNCITWYKNLKLSKNISYTSNNSMDWFNTIESINLFSKIKIILLTKISLFIHLCIKIYLIYNKLYKRKKFILKIKFLLFMKTISYFMSIVITKYKLETTLFSNVIISKYVFFNCINSFFLDTFFINKDIFSPSTNNYSYWWLFYTFQLKRIRTKSSAIHFKYVAFKTYSYLLKKKRKSKLESKKKIYRKRYYSKQDFYNFPRFYFEPISTNALNLYNQKMSLLKNDKKIVLYTFLNSILVFKTNSFITYKNITFLYKLPKETFFEASNTKWFQVFNLQDISSELMRKYI